MPDVRGGAREENDFLKIAVSRNGLFAFFECEGCKDALKKAAFFLSTLFESA
jgi:hypothetical protein